MLKGLARTPASWQESVGKFMTLSFKTISVVTLPPALNLTVIVRSKELRDCSLTELSAVRIQIDQNDFQNHHSAKSY